MSCGAKPSTEDGADVFAVSYPKVTGVVGAHLADRYSEHELKEFETLLRRLHE